MKEPKDKRTKEYKEWKETQGVEYTPKGLGTTIEKVLQSKAISPVTKVVKKIIFKDGKDCNCNKRIQGLNDPLLKEGRKPLRCLDEQQYEQYKLYKETRTLNVWNESEIHFTIKLYAHVFAIQYNPNDLCRNCTGSGKILFRISKELDAIYKSYK
jgi:hypothetical protein